MLLLSGNDKTGRIARALCFGRTEIRASFGNSYCRRRKALNLSLKDASDFVQQLGNVSGACEGKSIRIGNKSVISSEDTKTKELADGLPTKGKLLFTSLLTTN